MKRKHKSDNLPSAALPKRKPKFRSYTCGRCGHKSRMPKLRFMRAAGIKCDECGGQMCEATMHREIEELTQAKALKTE